MAAEPESRRRALRGAFAEHLPSRVARLAAAWRELRAGGGAAGELAAEAASLAGSSATLGFDELAGAARDLQLQLASSPARAAGDGEGYRARVDELVAALERVCRESVPGAGGELDGLADGGLPAGPARVERVLYLLGGDGALAHDLGLELGYFGYAVRRFEEAGDLLATLEQTPPTAVLLDATDFDRRVDEARRIDARRAEDGSGVPILFLSPRSDLEARLAAVRAGGDAFLPMPVEARRLVERLDLASPRTRSDPYRVLIVEDSYPRALDLALTLQRGGVATQLAEDRGRVWAALVEFAPDAMVIGAGGDGADALELAAVIRQQDEYAELPLILIAGDPRPAVRVEALRLAADEVLTRPVAEPHLLSTVTGHAHRARVRQRFASTDGLTGLLSHSAFTGRLGREVERARRQRRALTYAVLDVDHLSAINRTFGHLAGNSVLRSLGRLLARRLRYADLVSRWGGDEFVVALPDTPGEAGLSVLDQVRAMFAGVAQRSADGEFRATFSGGLTTLERSDGAAGLHAAARAALREARAAGRNRLEL